MGLANERGGAFSPFDFFTITLYALGQVFGLNHPALATGDPLTGPEGVLRRAAIGIENVRDSEVFRMVDVSHVRGVAGLYTQPVPEPVTFTLLLASLFGLMLLSDKESDAQVMHLTRG